MVPIGTPTISAASLYERPSTSTSPMTSRCSTGRRAMASWTERASAWALAVGSATFSPSSSGANSRVRRPFARASSIQALRRIPNSQLDSCAPGRSWSERDKALSTANCTRSSASWTLLARERAKRRSRGSSCTICSPRSSVAVGMLMSAIRTVMHVSSRAPCADLDWLE